MDGSGTLDEKEAKDLILHLGVDLTEQQLQEAIEDMDTGGNNNDDGNGDKAVTSLEFEQWVYMRKYERPRVRPCPIAMLQRIAVNMCPSAEYYAPGERIVEKGELGQSLFFMIQGVAEICHSGASPKSGLRSSHSFRLLDDAGHHLPTQATTGSPNSICKVVHSVNETDFDPLIGLMAILEEKEYQNLRLQTNAYFVRAADAHANYCELLEISRDDLLASFIDFSFGEDNNFSADENISYVKITGVDTGLKFWRAVARHLHQKMIRGSNHYWGDAAATVDTAGSIQEPSQLPQPLSHRLRPGQIAPVGPSPRQHSSSTATAALTKDEGEASSKTSHEQRLDEVCASMGKVSEKVDSLEAQLTRIEGLLLGQREKEDERLTT